MNRSQFLVTIRMAAAALATAVSISTLHATPYASCITNNAGTIQFYLNESNATVLVTYEDGTTNASFNGITTGTNVSAGQQSFVLAPHSSYSITVTKLGSGTPSLIKSLSIAGNPRGVDVNKNPASPFFGRVYEVNGGGSPAGVYLLNPDMSYVYTNTARNGGVTTFGSAGTGPGQSPYRLSVAADDSVIVGDATLNGAAVYQIDPNFTTNKLLLGPVGNTAGLAAGVHGTIESRPLLLGSTNTGNAVLLQIDGEMSPYNSLLFYNIGSGPLPWTNPPSYIGPQVGVGVNSIALGGNEYPGLTRGPNGYLYCSTFRGNLSNPNIQVYSADGTINLWNSWTPDATAYPGGTPTGDYFINTVSGVTGPLVDSAVSADGKYLVGLTINNGVYICALTNGIPNPASIFAAAGTGTTGNGRGIAMDAALNYYVSSSGLGAVQSWSLGITATAVTRGNATGQTNFALVLPATTVSVTATTPEASQSGPTPGVFTITRNSSVSADTNAPLTVSYTLSGTATNGTYTVSGGTTNAVTFAPGQNSTNVIITPVNDGLSRPTNTVILTLKGSGSYALTPPLIATVTIQNVGPQFLFISSTPAPSMYKRLTNDYGSFVITRWGLVNTNSYTITSLSYAGTASGAAYVPVGSVTFDPGVVSITNRVSPLVDTTSYVGNKTVIVSLGSGPGYTAGTNTSTLTILDNANPPATLIYSNSLTSANGATNWLVTAANNNMNTNAIDNTIDFGYWLDAANPLASQNGLITLPPSGATNALRITVNKNSAQGSGAAAGVNLYLTNQIFSGDYEVRFFVNCTLGGNASVTTEGPVFGINHTGNGTNWWTGSGIQAGSQTNFNMDGVWYWISGDGGAGAGDYIEYTGLGGTNGNTGSTTLLSKTLTSFTNIFKSPAPYSGVASGLIGNSSPANALALGNGYTNAWADVQIKNAKNIVTLLINKTVIFTYTNTTVWTNGYLMLGYVDPFSSVGAPDGAAYFADLKVVALSAPVITLQPTNLVVAAGGSASFAAAASFGSTAISTNYQWFLNGSAIAGATNTSYTFTAASTNYGTYSWSVSDGNFTVFSTNALLTPPVPNIVSVLPATRAAVLGSSPTFTVTANTFSGVTNYQWLSNSISISGGTSRTLTLANVAAGNFGSLYTVRVNDGTTSITSAPPVTLTLAVPQNITSLSLAGSSFKFGFNTEFGPSYVVDSQTNLTQGSWVPVSTNAGTGGTINVTNTTSGSQGFYRIRLQ